MIYMHTKDAAAIANVPQDTIRRWCREKKIDNAVHSAVDGKWCIPYGTVFPNGKCKLYQEPEPMDYLEIYQYFFGDRTP